MIRKLMRSSVPEMADVAEYMALLAQYDSMLYNKAEFIQQLDPKILSSVGLEHIRTMDPEVLRKSDIRSQNTKDLDNDGTANPLGAYLQWSRTTHEPLLIQQIISSHESYQMVVRHLFKISLPADRSSQDWDILIYASLNLTIFIGILIHLHELGYPAHWLSEAFVKH
ncbi:MAG: hypothetical protein Q9199_001898 [Rusavskia elegans]